MLSIKLFTLSIFVYLFSLVSPNSPPYFIIEEPSTSIQWANNITNYVTWTIDSSNEIAVFDVELGRLSQDGLYFIARNVPINAPGLPLVLQDVPSGDDYYLIFLNVTHGLVYSVSQRFSILDSGHSSTNPSKAPSVSKRNQPLAAVTVSGTPNPTMTFLHTFAAVSHGHRVVDTSLYWNIVLLSFLSAVYWLGLGL